MRFFIKPIFFLLFFIFISPAQAQAKTIYGAGATLPAPLYEKWIQEYTRKTHAQISYKAIGSGAGLRELLAGTITFAASDEPLSAPELEKNGLLQFPAVIGGVVPVFNLPDIPRGSFLLDGPTMAAIFMGDIRYWDAPEIKELNAKLPLPHKPIIRLYRKDNSGTSYILTHYLSQIDKAFAKKFGVTKNFYLEEGIPVQDSKSMIGATQETEGAIGYVSYAYVMKSKINYMRLINREGIPVSPNPVSFDIAASNAAWNEEENFGPVLTNQHGAQGWPLTSASFIFLKKKPDNLKNSLQVLDFFEWTYQYGSKTASQLDYVALPTSLSGPLHRAWHKIRKLEN